MKMVELNNVAKFINGYAFKPSDWVSDGLKIIRIQNLTNSEKTYNRTQKEVPEKYRIIKGDILVSWSATLDVFEWEDDEDALLNQHIFKIEPKLSVIDKKYLKYVLRHSIEKMAQFTHGSTMKHIVREDFLRHNIPLPPLEDQKRIVKIIDRADVLRQKRKQAINLFDDYLNSVFMEMFGDPLNNPKQWECLSLNNVCDEIYRYPTFYGFEYSKTGVPVIKIGNIQRNGIVDPDLSNYNFISKEVNNRYPRTIIELYDILMAVRGDGSTVKRVGLVTSHNLVGANISPNLLRFKTNRVMLLPHYLFALIISSQGQSMFEKYITQTAKKTITAKDIKNIAIPIPPLSIQSKFTKIVLETEKLKQNMVIQSEELENQFQALMQKAYKGKL